MSKPDNLLEMECRWMALDSTEAGLMSDSVTRACQMSPKIVMDFLGFRNPAEERNLVFKLAWLSIYSLTSIGELPIVKDIIMIDGSAEPVNTYGITVQLLSCKTLEGSGFQHGISSTRSERLSPQEYESGRFKLLESINGHLEDLKRGAIPHPMPILFRGVTQGIELG